MFESVNQGPQTIPESENEYPEFDKEKAQQLRDEYNVGERHNESDENEESSDYDPKDWVSFEAKIKSPEEKAIFRENMGQLDKRTRNYLRNLPSNIDQIFGAGSEGRSIMNMVQDKIIKQTIDGAYNLNTPPNANEGAWNLYLNNSGELYDRQLAAGYRKEDGQKSIPNPPDNDGDSGNSTPIDKPTINTKVTPPDDFAGFPQW